MISALWQTAYFTVMIMKIASSVVLCMALGFVLWLQFVTPNQQTIAAVGQYTTWYDLTYTLLIVDETLVHVLQCLLLTVLIVSFFLAENNKLFIQCLLSLTVAFVFIMIFIINWLIHFSFLYLSACMDKAAKVMITFFQETYVFSLCYLCGLE